MNYRLIVIVFLYAYGIMMRYVIGTSHSHRFQTKYKTYNLPKVFEGILFLSSIKKPVSFHALFIQICNAICMILLAFDLLDYMTVLKIFLILQFLVLAVLAIETVIWSLRYKGEYVSSDKRIKIDFERDVYSIKIDNKTIDGYLELYYPNNYKFFETEKFLDYKNKLLDYGKYRIEKKDSEYKFIFESLKNEQ
ncbi:MAG: hypothetical protein IJT65_08575 [Eubacterium sp.]|nr:hypothetical protein [Eubacterium sp.]